MFKSKINDSSNLILEGLDCVRDLIQRCPMNQLQPLSTMNDPILITNIIRKYRYFVAYGYW
jgi:hypothetical protein